MFVNDGEITEDLITVHNSIKQFFTNNLPNNFSLNQFHTLVLLSKTKGLNQRELGNKLLLKKSSVSGLVETLIKGKCIKSIKDKMDKRINHLFLTTIGESVVQNLQNKIAISKSESETLDFHKTILDFYRLMKLI